VYAFQSLAGDGDAFIDRGIEFEVVVLGLAGGDRSDPVQIYYKLSMALDERWRRKLFCKLVQPLDGAVGLFAFGADDCVALARFEVEDGVYFDQVDRAVGVFNRESFENFSHFD